MRLTEKTSASGCAAKLSPLGLQEIVRDLEQRKDPNLLVGFETSDDAAVYKIQDDLALIQTTDFITPIVDDPFTYGQIAAANAISDVYAMGGKPLTALNLCCFPASDIDPLLLRAILEGGLSKVAESGALLVGGHTVRDPEIKYGLAVTGIVHPRDVKPNRGARPGDAIVLTKAIGAGVITSAAKKGAASKLSLDAAISSMTQLNRVACEAMNASGAHVHAATDITGFGLAVHLLEVARASCLSLEIQLDAVPLFPEVKSLIAQGFKTGATFTNEQAAFGQMEFASSISREDQLIFFDPQTSGGLAIFIEETKVGDLVMRLEDSGILAARIGRASEGSPFLKVGR